MTIPIDLPFNFGVGAAIALSAGRRLRTDATPHAGHMVLRQAAWWGAWFGVNVAYQYFQWPDWMWAYIVDPTRVHAALVVPLFFLANMAFTMMGAGCASALLAKGRWGPAVGVMVFGFAAWGLTVFATFDAYKYIGTRTQFIARDFEHMTPVQDHKALAEASTWTVLFLAVSGVALLVTNVARGKKE
ncbi:MAG: hypothetical protein AAB434_03905 [Planctomycetota bacterium]